MTGTGNGKLRVGKAVSDAFGMVAGNSDRFLPYLMTAPVLAAGAVYLLGPVQVVYFPSGASMVTFGFNGLAGVLQFALLGLLFGALQTGMMMAIRGIQERRAVSFSDSLRGAVEHAVTNALITLAVWFASGVAGLFLLVPAIFFNVLFFVVKPAAISRKSGVSEAFGLASDLTAGNRWQIFGAMTLTGVILLALVGVSLVIVLTGLSNYLSNGDPGSPSTAVLVAITLLMFPVWLAFAVWTSLQMTIHATLVSLKSGQGDSVGEAFD